MDEAGFTARYASVRRFVGRLRGPSRPRPRPASSSRRPQARKHRSTTARARWCAVRRRATIGARCCLSHAGLPAEGWPVADVAVERTDLGRAARARVSASGWGPERGRTRQPQGRRAHAGHLRPGLTLAVSRRAGAVWRRRLVASAIPIVAKGRSSPASGTRRRRRCRDCTSRRPTMRKRISTAGRRNRPGGRDVYRGAARAAAAARGADFDVLASRRRACARRPPTRKTGRLPAHWPRRHPHR